MTTENKNILIEADEITGGSRQEDYGSPEDSFQRIADYWELYLKTHVSPVDVARMMILLKLARQEHSPKRDNLVDIAGYARTEEMIGGIS